MWTRREKFRNSVEELGNRCLPISFPAKFLGKLDDADLEADALLAMATGNGTGGHGKIPIKTEFGMLHSETPRKRKFSKLDLDPDLIEILDSPVDAEDPKTNVVPISSCVETSAALFVAILKHPRVSFSIAAVSEKYVEMGCTPRDLPVPQFSRKLLRTNKKRTK